MGQLVPSLPRAIRVARSSPKGDDWKQASSFKNSGRGSMTVPSDRTRRGREHGPGIAEKSARSASGGCRQFADPVERYAVRVGPTLSRTFENRYVYLLSDA